jgi:drug/metabolite transporter (DMT)-like permease
LRFYLLALRSFGAARTGSVFAFAPLIGALAAFALDERSASTLLVLGGSLIVFDVLLHHHHTDLAQTMHSHAHKHVPLNHSHAHAPDAHHVHRH